MVYKQNMIVHLREEEGAGRENKMKLRPLKTHINKKLEISDWVTLTPVNATLTLKNTMEIYFHSIIRQNSHRHISQTQT